MTHADPIPFRPLHDYIIVERDPTPDKTRGGLWLPEDTQEKAITGRVVAVGPGAWAPWNPTERIPLRVAVGERVLFGEYAGRVESKRVLETDTRLLLHDHEVLAVLEDDEMTALAVGDSPR